MLDMPQFKHNKTSTKPPKGEDTCSAASLSSLYSEGSACSGYLQPQKPEPQGDILGSSTSATASAFFRRRMIDSPERTTYMDPTLTKINYYMAQGTIEKALATKKEYWSERCQYLRKKGYSISDNSGKLLRLDPTFGLPADTEMRLGRYFFQSKKWIK